jgi:hypothetical protein
VKWIASIEFTVLLSGSWRNDHASGGARPPPRASNPTPQSLRRVVNGPKKLRARIESAALRAAETPPLEQPEHFEPADRSQLSSHPDAE